MEKALRVIVKETASPFLQLSEDGKKVTRVKPFKPADKEQVEARTIYVENLPSDADHESLKKVAHSSLPNLCIFFNIYFLDSNEVWFLSKGQ